MKKLLCLTVLIFLLSGCSLGNGAMDAALALRETVDKAGQITFDARISADYIDHVEQFTLRCKADETGAVAFEVIHPAEISGITGAVAGQQGTLTFDGTILAFPLLAQERLSPVSGPWVMLSALRSGRIISCGEEGELIRLTVNDTYADDALTVDLWFQDDRVTAAEIGWRGIRQMTMELDGFALE